MPDLVVSAAFEYIDKSNHIGIHIGVRILYRIPDTGLGCQVDHDIDLFFLEHTIECFKV